VSIYFDNASTTSLDPEVKEAYLRQLDEFANADALYDWGVSVYRKQELSREKIAQLLNIDKQEVIFTSGASEANNMAIKGLCLKKRKGHIISSIYEHSSSYEALKQMESLGFAVTYLYPDKDGLIDPLEVEKNIQEDTFLVSIMHVNNEVGYINDIETIKSIVKKKRGCIFHCDITQAIGKIDIDLKDIDLASFSAHKIHGLKGSGVLIKKRHIELEPLISGGQQEFSLRGGTSNAASNIVLAKTLRLALQRKEKHQEKVKQLKTYLLENLRDHQIYSNEYCIDDIIMFKTKLTSEVMLNALNQKGIMVSAKSTCGSRSEESSRSLLAMNYDDKHAIRVSFDSSNTIEEVQYFCDALKEVESKYE